MTGMAASLRIDGPALTADAEATQIDTVVVIDEEGQHSITLLCRDTGKLKITQSLTFDAYEWERLKKVIADIDASVARIQEHGAVFRMG